MSNLQSKKILTYEDVTRAAPGMSDERLIDVRSYDTTILAEYLKSDMKPYTGSAIYVRDSLAHRLAEVNRHLSSKNLRLKIVYGYRHPTIQMRYFSKRYNVLAKEFPDMSDSSLQRYTHNFVAIPDVAGHPTGGAVDLTIVDDQGSEIDMGNLIADYADPEIIKTFARNATTDQKRNRQLLHDLMVQQGFAPFYGEWWHFSFGDREWAAFYHKKTALFGPIEFKI